MGKAEGSGDGSKDSGVKSKIGNKAEKVEGKAEQHEKSKVGEEGRQGRRLCDSEVEKAASNLREKMGVPERSPGQEAMKTAGERMEEAGERMQEKSKDAGKMG
eukprot:Sspe_Gene.29325::Locus_13856_Transcript_3_4_Confidence_0.556_Length_612::g.29325::m.29325